MCSSGQNRLLYLILWWEAIEKVLGSNPHRRCFTPPRRYDFVDSLLAWFLNPIFNTIVPDDERSTRQQLEGIITSYFQGLTDHKPIEADYDPRCDRYHSGNRVTHNAKNGVEDSGEVGCYESNLGPKPWGPATEVRISLVDPERGIVVAYSLLYYANSDRRMQINEVFKILNGRIRLIDNIGLMEEGIKTSGFTELKRSPKPISGGLASFRVPHKPDGSWRVEMQAEQENSSSSKRAQIS
jgi:hypothetical protein